MKRQNRGDSDIQPSSSVQWVSKAEETKWRGKLFIEWGAIVTLGWSFKGKTKDLFVSCLRVVRKSMVLFSFHPNGRENTYPGGGAERTKGKTRAFYLPSVACSSFSKHMSRVCQEGRTSGKGSIEMLPKDRPTEMCLDPAFHLKHEQTEVKIRGELRSG